MAGRILSRKKEGSDLWQQPVIAQGLSCVGVPVTSGRRYSNLLTQCPFWFVRRLTGKPCRKGDRHAEASLGVAASSPKGALMAVMYLTLRRWPATELLSSCPDTARRLTSANNLRMSL